jgi:hypothetical protein
LFQTPTPKRASAESTSSTAQPAEELASKASNASGDAPATPAILDTAVVQELLRQAGRKKAKNRGGKRNLKRARGPYINAAKVAKIKRDIGDFNLQALSHVMKPEQRRHVMAIAANTKAKLKKQPESRSLKPNSQRSSFMQGFLVQ